jgi:hypothetical protein
MQSTITVDDVIASFDKYGNIFTWNENNYRDLKEKNSKALYDCTYIDLNFKNVSGKEMKAKFKFSEQVCFSGAKAPEGSDDKKEGPNSISVAFSHMSEDDIKVGFPAKEKANEEKQTKENKRVSDNIKKYVENNNKFLKVLNIIDASYKLVCEDMKSKSKTLKFRLKKDRNVKEVNIFSIKQSSRLDRDTNQDVDLEHPIYRVKAPVYRKDGRVGIYSNYHKEFKYTVFDAKKMTKKNNYTPVPARVKVKGKLRDLDVNNASAFWTRLSLIGGTLTYDCVVSSKFGLSLSNSFFDAYVFRCNVVTKEPTLSAAELSAMRGGASSEDEDEDEDVEIIDKDDKSEPHDSDDDAGIARVSAEPHDSDDDDADADEGDADEEDAEADEDDEDEEEEEPSKKKAPRKSKK